MFLWYESRPVFWEKCELVAKKKVVRSSSYVRINYANWKNLSRGTLYMYGNVLVYTK